MGRAEQNCSNERLAPNTETKEGEGKKKKKQNNKELADYHFNNLLRCRTISSSMIQLECTEIEFLEAVVFIVVKERRGEN